MSERIPPLPPEAWPAAMREALAALRPPRTQPADPTPPSDRPKGLHALGMFAHHPELTKAFFTFNGHVLSGTTLSPRQRELLVLRVAAARQSEYEWAQHALLGRDAGLTDEEIQRVADDPGSDAWTPLERALLTAADELLADARISDPTWATLAAELDVQQRIDLVFTVGAYDLVAMAFRSFDVELDDDLRYRKSPSP